VTVIPPPMFSFPLSDDAVLILRTASIADSYNELVAANQERLAQWEPWALKPPVLAETRSFLEASARGWIEGSELPVAIAVREDGQWHLAGAASLRINGYARSGEIGYWIGRDHEGRGLITKTVAALLDEAFGPLGIDRVTLHTDPANERSRAVARRLGFVEEATLRQATAFPDERRDEVVYGLMAREWLKRPDRQPGPGEEPGVMSSGR
jgi:ribosomal-protein-serine acetyltransferase